MKKRRKVLVALAMAVTMLTPTGISAAEYGQVSGLPNAQEEVQDADGITNDSNELSIVDEKIRIKRIRMNQKTMKKKNQFIPDGIRPKAESGICMTKQET